MKCSSAIMTSLLVGTCLAASLVPALGNGTALAQQTRRAAEEPLPIPPIPPTDMAGTMYEAAPTPGQIGAAPGGPQGPRGPELAPTLMTPKQFYQGEGFLAGSTVQSEQQRKAKPAAGFNLTVPLN